MNASIKASARFISGKLLPRMAYPVFRGPLKGAKFILGSSAGAGGGASVYFNMSEPEQTLAFVNTLKTNQVLFDIGANVGYYTIMGARLVGPRGKVFAFEPVVRNLSYLYRHVILNKVSNVTIIPAACSDSVSLARFSAGLNFAMGHLDTHPGNCTTEKFPILSVTVDEVVQKMGVYPDVMKIDVEGAELLVLKGAEATLRDAKTKIFLSTHSETLRKTCLEYLDSIGFTAKALDKDEKHPSEFFVKHAD